ncbi:MAG: glycosyltransferase family 4 protein [Candidatus Pacebacteria bacterium]|jgi:L-malate glycosyltransferase|nr:glycosyltransferase family 4 protein [Candidatus Paceibacterota bacterium]
MKILHTVEFYNPSVGGAQEVVKQLSEHLVNFGHSVTVATSKLSSRNFKLLNGVKIKEFNISGNQVRGFTGEVEKYKRYLQESKFDVVMNYAAQQWATDLFFQVIDNVVSKKVFVPCGFSALYNNSYAEYFSKLPKILKKYDATIYLSNNYRDINFARKYKVNNRIVIPNGADEREFCTLSTENNTFRKNNKISQDNFLIVTIGNHTGTKGHNEAIKVLRNINIDNITLVIIGKKNTTSKCYKKCKRSELLQNKIISKFSNNKKQLKILHLERDETINALKSSDMFLFLSNIECSPLVLFEAAASGKPFVSSDCGNAGEIAAWTKSGMIAKSIQDKYGYTRVNTQDVIKKITILEKDKQLRSRLGNAGRKSWQNFFTWNKITREYEKLYTKILKK